MIIPILVTYRRRRLIRDESHASVTFEDQAGVSMPHVPVCHKAQRRHIHQQHAEVCHAGRHEGRWMMGGTRFITSDDTVRPLRPRPTRRLALRRRRLLLCIICLLLVIPVVNPTSARALRPTSLTPVLLEVTLMPGQSAVEHKVLTLTGPADIPVLDLRVEPLAFSSWLTGAVATTGMWAGQSLPLHDIHVPDVGLALGMDLTFTVPPGTAPGRYEFTVIAVGSRGESLGQQAVVITVPGRDAVKLYVTDPYANGAELLSGDIEVTFLPNGLVDKVVGGGTIPGKYGGTATVSISVNRILTNLFDKFYFGIITIDDPSHPFKYIVNLVFGTNMIIRTDPTGGLVFARGFAFQHGFIPRGTLFWGVVDVT